MGAGVLAALKIHLPLDGGAGNPGDGGNDSALAGREAFYHCLILPADQVFLYHIGQQAGAELVAGQEQQAGSVPV